MKNKILKHLSLLTGLIRHALTFFIVLIIVGSLFLPGKKATVLNLMESDSSLWMQNGQMPPFSMAIYYIISTIIILLTIRLSLIYFQNILDNLTKNQENSENLKKISLIILIGTITQIIINIIFYLQSPKTQRFFFTTDINDYIYNIIFLAIFSTAYEISTLKNKRRKNERNRNRR